MIVVVLGFLAVTGLVIGSFSNVVVYRVPRKLSVVTPPSACPNCTSRIAAYDNIPVISWLVLRGRCRHCAARISPRYPLVELGTGLAFVVVGLFFAPAVVAAATLDALASSALVLAAFVYLAAISIALALIDLDVHKLPNAIVLPAYGVGLALLGGAALLGGDWGAVLRMAIAAVAMFIAYLIMALAYPRGMGLGDVKLAGVLGLFLGYLGWGEVAVGAFAAFVLGGLFAIILLAAKRVGRKSGIPFGPWMLAGAWVGVFVGREISDWYLGLVGLA